MPSIPLLAVAVLAAYLLGSIPTSYLVGRLFKNIDLREHGSGNLGASNVYRVLGPHYAVPVALFDVAKGALPAGILGPAISDQEVVWVGLGVIAVLGHMFSVWVRFKGGKGGATGTGVVLALAPLAVPIILVVWLVLVRVTKIPAVGTIIGAIVAPIATYLLYPERLVVVGLLAALALVIVGAHQSNIRRLLAGKEHRLEPDGQAEAQSDAQSGAQPNVENAR
ncbi:glycerol-3-phosphate 1-O-acyltransferase PlsY [Paraliomyxa miuraensis]|uniref:glycerol-3-phosphate 1-O-acyltransferase PlsY n=1 Tax=Paraliomyxa miuraensis TaxID=376150 RepID=UPI002257A0A3|nr:glycerol-3-phosphate 1-O-acyltransferase PlsY [Paraliomyxa miuraensis]MCX4242994.1 glycerol-3-phosphate 1-O-acyltransferase PlsY [Paraliomyxa miuraensis]